MPTIDELSDPLANYLLPVLKTRLGVCPKCHTSIVGTFPTCWQCNSAKRTLPLTADAMSFVSLAPKGDQLDQELRFYKKESNFPGRIRTENGLAATLWRWLKIHESCVARRAGVTEFPIVTTIPSTKGRINHPLRYMVSVRVGGTAPRYRDLLIANPNYPEELDRAFSTERFLLSSQVEQRVPILIIDDTFATGSRVQSAAALLKQSGAGPIGVVCIGRHFDPNQEGEYGVAAKNYLKLSRSLTWDWNYCCLCDDR